MRRLIAYLPSMILALVGAVMFGALIAGFNPYCQCTGFCSCPAEVGPPFPSLTLAVLGAAGLLAIGTFLVRKHGKAGRVSEFDPRFLD